MKDSNHPAAAFLLAQIGAHAASKFAERLGALALAPHHAGIVRTLASTSGLTQQALADRLGMVPSRLVALIDEMESAGWVERRSDPDDRRRNALHLTTVGRAVLEKVGRVAREHSQHLLAALAPEEQRQLSDLLNRIAEQQGLTPGVHPGYRNLNRAGTPPE